MRFGIVFLESGGAMHIERFLCKLVFAPIFFIALFSSSAIAGSTERILPIPDSSEVDKVEMVLTPQDLQTRFPWREQDLYSMGCRFAVSGDQTKIDDLINILRDYLSASSNTEKTFALRNAVYLHLNDGTKLTFLFSDVKNPNKQAHGVIRSEDNASGITVTGQRGILSAFKKWASFEVVKVNFFNFCLQN